MRLKSIKLQLVLRILLLAISLGLVAFLLVQKESTLQGLYASLFPVALTIELIYYLDRNNRHIRTYLEAIKWDDMGVKMPESIPDKSFLDLNRSLNLFNKKLEVLRNENMTQFYFTQALIKDALIGLAVVDQDKRVFFVNKSFEQLIGKSRIQLQNPAKEEMALVWDQIADLEINEKRSVEIEINGQLRILLFQVSEFVIDRNRFCLYSAQNIKSELENTEIEAWKKLMRILSHEILNSTSPILSLSRTLSDMIQDEEYEQDALIKQLAEGLDVINQRSTGLIKFTNAFSTLSKLPEPEKTEIMVEELLQNLQVLYRDWLKEERIEFKYTVIPGAEVLFADRFQIEQVLINLVKNAIESFPDRDSHKKIEITASTFAGFFRAEIADNGKGISSEKMDKVFLPFFTTRESGNGIGLALSKQILNHHQGNIWIESKVDKGTKVILEVPAIPWRMQEKPT